MNGTGLRLGAACGAAFLWGTGSLVVNLLVSRHGYQPQSISFWRFVLGAASLLLVFGRAMPWRRLLREGAPLLGAGAVMASYVLLWFIGIAHIGAAIPTLIALCLP
nr:EamA family transporter [Pseudomonadota bacterium]